MSTTDKSGPSKLSSTSGYKIDKEIVVALLKDNVSVKEIAEKVDCTERNLYAMMARLKRDGVLLKSYRDKELDAIDTVRSEILANIHHAVTKGDMVPEKPSEVTSLSLAFCQLTDKSLLIQGKATSNVNIQSYEYSVKELHVMDGKIKELEQELSSCGSEGVD